MLQDSANAVNGQTGTDVQPAATSGPDHTVEILPPPFEPRSDIVGLRVLIVDPVRFHRDLIKSSLVSRGISYFVEADTIAQAGKRMANADGVDLIILDNELDGETGLDFTRRVRRGETRLDPAIPIVMVTAVTSADIVHKARNAGVHEVVSRPFDMGTLIEHVSKPFLCPRAFIRAPGYVGPDRRWERNKRRKADRRSGDGPAAG